MMAAFQMQQFPTFPCVFNIQHSSQFHLYFSGFYRQFYVFKFIWKNRHRCNCHFRYRLNWYSIIFIKLSLILPNLLFQALSLFLSFDALFLFATAIYKHIRGDQLATVYYVYPIVLFVTMVQLFNTYYFNVAYKSFNFIKFLNIKY